ncbi:MAG: sulfotransferase family 2 domain-containing protein, partial [Bacteroidia bacterium]|nr:sulfotransferase family 2 domain-containing protein [Bacteroidia bacterium]
MGAILQQPDINNLVFLHIPKCAGSTFLFILNHQYKKLPRFDVAQTAPNKSNEQLLSELSEVEREKIHLIRGHVLFKIHKHLIGTTKYITFLRHPVSRVVSLYHFMKNTPQNRLYPV